MRHALIFLGIVPFAACKGDLPADPLAAVAEPPASLRSACQSVSGRIIQTGQFPSFEGAISGDIEGFVSTQLDPAESASSGKVRFSAGLQVWHVTGGTVPNLIGQTVRLALESEVVFTQPSIGLNNTRARVIESAASGNLTYHGSFNATPPPPFAVDVVYRGVICI